MNTQNTQTTSQKDKNPSPSLPTSQAEMTGLETENITTEHLTQMFNRLEAERKGQKV